MELNIFDILSIFGLIAIIIGVLLVKQKSRKYQYLSFIIGGLCLEIYSIYIKNIIFIILQAVFTLSAAYGLIKVKANHR